MLEILPLPGSTAWTELLWHVLQARPQVRDAVLDRLAARLLQLNKALFDQHADRLLEILLDDFTHDLPDRVD